MSNVLNYKGYISKPEMSLEDGILYGKIEGINDLVTFEGETIIELKSAFEQAVDDYLEYCEEIGKDPERAYKGTFNVRIDPELHKKAVRISIECGTTLNSVVEKSIESFVQNYEEGIEDGSNKIHDSAQKEMYSQTLEMWEKAPYIPIFNCGQNLEARSLKNETY